MPSNNSKYSPEMREQTVKYIFEKNRSATQITEEMGIDTNTVCRWVRDYRRRHNLPSYAETKGMKRAEPKSNTELLYQVKELEREMKKKEKRLKMRKRRSKFYKIPAHLHATPRMKHEAIHRYHSEFSVVKMCEVLTVRQSGYYQWRKGEVHRQVRANRELGLIRTVEEVFYESNSRSNEALVKPDVTMTARLRKLYRFHIEGRKGYKYYQSLYSHIVLVESIYKSRFRQLL